jgi:DNA-binding MarR family transcriptional regulator
MRELDRIVTLYPSLVKVMSRLRNLLQEGMDLSYNQYKTLLTLYDGGPMPLSRLGERLKVAASSASEMADRLEKAGFVERRADGNDRRSVTVALTPEGERLLARLQEGVVESYRKILGRLEPSERQRLVRAVEDLVDIIGKTEGA